MSSPLDDNVIGRDYVMGLFDLRDRVAVVTGGASGLGEAIAIGYGHAGMHVVVADVDRDRAEQVAGAITAAGGSAVSEHLDVVDRRSCDEANRRVIERFGAVDVLVNSAGTAFRCPAEDFPEDRLDLVLDLNLKGTYLPCQAFGRTMLSQGRGSIINIGSIGCFAAYPLASAYLASKGGVVQLTKSLALEWHGRGVRVNGIGPTLMDSPLTRTVATTTSETADFIMSRMLRPRLGLPRELIGAAIFLASDAASLVTGHMLMCDDGYLVA